MWEQMHEGLGPAQLVLLQEACRMADRLDRLDAVLEGRDWVSFQVGEGVTEVTVTVDRALSEARQQATALKQLVAELRQSSPKAASPPKLPAPERKAGGLGDLSARIAARRAAPAD